jgi:hypothetical protein
VQSAIAMRVAEAAAAVGLSEGPVHAELRLGPDGPTLLEIASRSIGGLCGRALRFAVEGRTHHSLAELVIAHAIGHDLGPARREPDATGVHMLPVPGAGVLRRVDGVDAARAVPGVHDVAITARVGDRLVPLPEGHAYLGFVFATGAAPDEVVAALRQAAACLRFEIGALLH